MTQSKRKYKKRKLQGDQHETAGLGYESPMEQAGVMLSDLLLFIGRSRTGIPHDGRGL